MPKDKDGKYVPPPDDKRCNGIKAGGDRCPNYRVDNGFCNFHDPGFDMTATSAKGGQGTRKHVTIENLAHLSKAIARGDAGALFQFPGPDGTAAQMEDVVLETPEDAERLLAQSINDVRKGNMTMAQAQMTGYLVSQWLNAHRTVRPGSAEELLVPEITVMEKSDDPRVTGDEYPGSEYVTRKDTAS